MRCGCSSGRQDYVDEIGSAQLVLGRALLEQDRLDEAEAAFAAAESSFDQLGSASHRAAAWVARAISLRGAATTGLQHTSTAPRLRHSRTSGSREEGGVVMTKARLLSLLGCPLRLRVPFRVALVPPGRYERRRLSARAARSVARSCGDRSGTSGGSAAFGHSCRACSEPCTERPPLRSRAITTYCTHVLGRPVVVSSAASQRLGRRHVRLAEPLACDFTILRC